MGLRLLVGLCLVAMLSIACQTIWYNDAKGEQEFNADSAECMAQAGQASGHNDPYGAIRQGTFQRCMKGRGYYTK